MRFKPLRALFPIALTLTCNGYATAATTATTIDSLTASDVVANICNRQFSAEAVTTAYLGRALARLEFNAFVTLDQAGALAAARETDAKLSDSKAKCLPLQGLPIVVKDNIQVANLPATAGTPALRNFVPSADAPVVKKLRDAGAIVLGKTNMHELAVGVSGYNTAFNTGSLPGIRNAYDITRAAGGSSSGTASAVGSRIAPAGLGTDTSASVRLPCAFNGCVSLRPTAGRYPQEGIAPLAHTLDTAGPMAVSMADVELLDRVITEAAPVNKANLKNIRLGIVPDFLANLDVDTQAAFNEALNKLQAAGVTLVNVSMPSVLVLASQINLPVSVFEAYHDMVAYLARYNTGLDIQQLVAGISSPDAQIIYYGLVLPQLVPTAEGLVPVQPVYDAAITTHRPALKKLYAKTFEDNRLDALVFPTTPKVAMLANPEASGFDVGTLYTQNTVPGSNAGLPGLQLPIGMGTEVRVPIGLEIDGPVGSDRRLISIGLSMEEVFGRIAPPANAP